jgi:hypothetical protein
VREPWLAVLAVLAVWVTSITEEVELAISSEGLLVAAGRETSWKGPGWSCRREGYENP